MRKKPFEGQKTYASILMVAASISWGFYENPDQDIMPAVMGMIACVLAVWSRSVAKP